MLMTNQQAAKLSEPRIGSFYDPSTLVSTKFAAVPQRRRLLFIRCGAIKSMPRFLNRSRS